MTPTARRQVSRTIDRIVIAIALIAIVVGWVRVNNTQESIRQEIAARAESECRTLRDSVKPLRRIIKFSTEPAPLDGLTPERIAVITELNAQRAKARADLLPLVPVLKCPQ